MSFPLFPLLLLPLLVQRQSGSVAVGTFWAGLLLGFCLACRCLFKLERWSQWVVHSEGQQGRLIETALKCDR